MSASFRHPSALIESTCIGDGTYVAAFSHISSGAVIGNDCHIAEQVIIESDVVLGDRVSVTCGAKLLAGLRVEDDVVIGPNATFPNNSLTGKSRQAVASRPTILRRGASVGANASVLPGLTGGQHAIIGAGAVVTRSVPPHAIVAGNPARILRYGSTLEVGAADQRTVQPAPSSMTATVQGVTLERISLIKDLRGNLAAREVGNGLPFVPQRYFIVLDVPGKELRGAHAHRKCKQLLVCLRGSLSMVADDGVNLQEFVLDTPELALYLPPMVWGIQYKYTAGAMLLVLASEPYDAADYIRDYDEFLRERARSQQDKPAP